MEGLFGAREISSAHEMLENESLHHQVAALHVDPNSAGGVQVFEGTPQPLAGSQPKEQKSGGQLGD